MRLLMYKTLEGSRMAIVGAPGRKWSYAVWIDAPMRLNKVSNREIEKYGIDKYADETYTKRRTLLRRAARNMLEAGKTLGISLGAKRHLKVAAKA